eukprot:11181448-Heterocapsa_arctica.AAC.1
MERDVQEARPTERRREGQRYSDIEGDSDSFFSHTSEESGDVQNYPDDTMEEERKPWTKHETVPAAYIEELECQMMTEHKMDTEW